MDNFKCNIYVLLTFVVCGITISDENGLVRRKRYVVFPEGASLTVELCFTVNILNMPTNIFTEIINFGINYDLPNKTSFALTDFRQSQHVMQRRQRRDLYRKFEIVLEAMGFDGRTCIYKALCETSQNLYSKGRNMYEELLRIIFRFPLQELHNFEPEDHRLYHWAHGKGYEIKDCSELFPDCRVSIIDIMLGYAGRKDKNPIW